MAVLTLVPAPVHELSPKVSAYYEVDKIDGLYVEGGVTYTLQASEKVGIDLGALAGFSAGQDADFDAAGNRRPSSSTWPAMIS